MLWALAQPAAALGLAGAFLLGLGMRVLAQRLVARRLGLAAAVPLRPHPRADVDPVGAVALLLGGTGWGRGAVVLSGRSGPRFFALAAGPVLVLAASQAAGRSR